MRHPLFAALAFAALPATPATAAELANLRSVFCGDSITGRGAAGTAPTEAVWIPANRDGRRLN